MKKALFNDREQLVKLMAEFYAEAVYKLKRSQAAKAFEILLTDERFGHVWLIQSESQNIGYIVLTPTHAV
jgi:hypothetical protein